MRIANTYPPLPFSPQNQSFPVRRSPLNSDAFSLRFGASTAVGGNFGVSAPLYRAFIKAVADGDTKTLKGCLTPSAISGNNELLKHALCIAKGKGHTACIDMLNSALARNALIQAISEGDESALIKALETPLSAKVLETALQMARREQDSRFVKPLTEALARRMLTEATQGNDSVLRGVCEMPVNIHVLREALRIARGDKVSSELVELVINALVEHTRL